MNTQHDPEDDVATRAKLDQLVIDDIIKAAHDSNTHWTVNAAKSITAEVDREIIEYLNEVVKNAPPLTLPEKIWYTAQWEWYALTRKLVTARERCVTAYHVLRGDIWRKGGWTHDAS